MLNKAKQIWLKEECVNQYMEAMTEFELTSVPDTAPMQIYCDTEYVLWINGNFASTGQYKSMDNKRVYDTVDVSQFLVAGTNRICIWAYHQGTNSSAYCLRPAGLAFALQAGANLITSDKDTAVRPLSGYKCGEIEKVSVQLGYVYYFDARDSEAMWQKPQISSEDVPFEMRPVDRLVHEEVITGKIKSQGHLIRSCDGTAAMQVQRDYMAWRSKNEIFSGNIVTKNESGVYILIDLQDQYAGLYTMDIEASEGTVIDIAYGEHLDDMRVRAEVGGRNFTCRYVCKEGRQQFTGYFRRFAARYIQLNITNMTRDLTIHQAGLIPTVYPLSREAFFECNDYFCNKLYDISVKTLKLCMHEHYEDCPWREQALYGFDSFVQMMCGYYAFGEYKFPKASLRLLADSRTDNGLLRITSPNKAMRTIPSFSLCWILSLEKYVFYSGDMEFGAEMLPVALGILDAYKIQNDVVHIENDKNMWHFYEWTDGLDGSHYDGEVVHSPDAPSNFYYILAADAVNKICTYMCREPIFDIEPMKKAVHETFFDAKTGLYKTDLESGLYHELTQSLALLSGVTHEKELAKVLISKDSRLIKTTLSTAYYKYDAILSIAPEYLSDVMDEIALIWGDMIYAGASSLWETSAGADDFDNAGSLCHAWSAVPLYILYRYVLCFHPVDPGFLTYRLHPTPTKNITHIKTMLYMPRETHLFDEEL